MYKDWCPECGHMLSGNRKCCSFCGFSQQEYFICNNPFEVGDENQFMGSNDFEDDVDRYIDKITFERLET